MGRADLPRTCFGCPTTAICTAADTCGRGYIPLDKLTDAERRPGPQPCPFCGGAVAVLQAKGTVRLTCRRSACGAMGPMRETEADAIRAWNRPSGFQQGTFDQQGAFNMEEFLGTAVGTFAGSPFGERLLKRLTQAMAKGQDSSKKTQK